MGNVRLCEDHNEILNMLKELQAEDCKVCFWDSHGPREVVDMAAIASIDEKENLLILDHLPKRFLPANDSAQTIYLKGNYQSLLLKDEHILVDKEVAIHIPGIVRILEKRLEPRHFYGMDSPYFVSIEKTIKEGMRPKPLEFSLFDLSPSGMALNIAPEEARFFNTGDIFEVNKIGKINFMIPIRGEVKYTGHMEYEENGVSLSRIKVGIHFDRRLSDITVDTMEKTSKS